MIMVVVMTYNRMRMVMIEMVEEVIYNSMEGEEMKREVVVIYSSMEVVVMDQMEKVVIYNSMGEEEIEMEVVVTCSLRRWW